VFVWSDGGHIAIIDTVESITTDDKGKATAKVWICESCGASSIRGDVHTDGLNYTQYLITEVSPSKVFKVYRAGGWEKASSWDARNNRQTYSMGVYISRVV
jgi:hypothetical protein